MIRVEERSLGAKFRVVSLENPEQAARWLASLEGQLGDLRAAAWDRLHKKRNRVLSRHEARRQFQEADWAITQLIAAAKAGLDLPTTLEPAPDPDQEEGDESPPESGVTPPTPESAGE